MSKIVKNITASQISVPDVGVTISANSQIIIPPEDYLLWASSSDIITYVGASDVVVNDGSFDLSISDGIDLIKGLYSKKFTLTDGTNDLSLVDDAGVKRLPVDASITAIVEPSEFYFNVVRGHTTGHTGHTTYGRIPELDINDISTLTPFGSETWLQTSQKVQISSDSALDTLTGTGAQSVTIYGLTDSYVEQQETLSMNGSTWSESINTYLRINFITVAAVGSDSKNNGTIKLRSKTTNDILGQMEPGNGNSEQLVFTVPAGKTCYITSLRASITSSTGTGPKESLLQFWIRPIDSSWKLVASEGLTSQGGSAWFDLTMPLPVPEKTDVKMVAISKQNNTEITGIAQYIMVENA